MGAYRITTTAGTTHEGTDERDTSDLVEAITEARKSDADKSDLPAPWVWLAGFYLDSRHVIAVEYVMEDR